jgi:tetratricopeptide (TPR) repeat protein
MGLDMQQAKKRLDAAYNAVTSGKDYKEALRLCNEVLSEHPSMLDGLRAKARIYAYTGAFNEAIVEMNTVIEQNPKDPGDYFSRGRWLLDSGKWTEALSDMTKTLNLGLELDLDYYTESAYFFRSVALLRLGRHSDALADCAHVRDDFLVHLWDGKISKSDILEQAQATS